MNKVQKGYNAWSKIYDSNANKTRDLEGVVLREILSSYHFDQVLELGCGTGKNTFWLAERSKQLLGLDFSKEMLTLAKSRNKYPHVQLQLADILQDWGVEADTLDLITCSLVLEHIEHLGTIFAQAAKKMKANGLFYICELHPFKQYLGAKARYEEDGKLVELPAYVHHVSEYITLAKNHGFELTAFNEWFDDGQLEQPPRLVSFVFSLVQK